MQYKLSVIFEAETLETWKQAAKQHGGSKVIMLVS